MKLQRYTPVLRSHVLRMTLLCHQAVDHAIKAYQLGNPDFSQLVRNSEQDWRNVQRSIGERGRFLLAAGKSIDSHSLFARCSVRIYSALRVTYTAAAEIAHNSVLIAESGQPIRSVEIGPMGNYVNSLVRLNTVAIFNTEPRHSRTILNGHNDWKWFELALLLTHKRLVQLPGTQARAELAIARSLGQIADQAHEIADAFVACLNCEGCLGVLDERAA